MASSKAFEGRIIRLLEKKPLSTKDIAMLIRLPRTSAGYHLRRLEKDKKLTRIWEAGQQGALWVPKYTSVHDKRYIRLYEGPKFYEGLTLLHKLPKGSIVFNLVGKSSVRHVYKHIPRRFLEFHQQTLKRRRLIIKAFIHPESNNVMEISTESLLKSHEGRSVAVKVMDDFKAFDSSAEYIISRDWIMISNSRLRRRLVIKDPDMTFMLFHLIEKLYDLPNSSGFSTYTHDLNQDIKNQLERFKKQPDAV